jgi:hypothetical protein
MPICAVGECNAGTVSLGNIGNEYVFIPEMCLAGLLLSITLLGEAFAHIPVHSHISSFSFWRMQKFVSICEIEFNIMTTWP